ncbi:MAG: ATP-binding protein [Thaumarchaeota archaeon]|nr:ATP-binding protein [Nitrososphaerota archaeon]
MHSQELERLNEWWGTKSVREELAPSYHRKPFDDALRLLGYRQAVMLTGLRRVGKSTILYQLVKRLLRDEKPSRILYYSFEEGGESTRAVMEAYEREVLKKPLDEAGKVYVFLDEVQYSGDWLPTVKRYYDLYPKLKLYLSGSSSLLISGRALASLAGRFFFVEVYPMSFREFVEARGALPAGGEPSSRLEPVFFDYLRKAGFPELVTWEDDARIVEYVRNSVVDRVLLRDLPVLFGPRDTLLLGRLLAAFASRPGSMANLNELAGEFGATRITVARYLKSLETSLLLRPLGNFRPSTRSSSRKLRKYYPATTSLIRAVSREAYEADTGGVLETYVVNAVRASHYYRKGQVEIDAVLHGGETAVEVKQSPDARDALKLSRAAASLGARRKMIVASSDSRQLKGVEVVPAYALEWKMEEEKKNW